MTRILWLMGSNGSAHRGVDLQCTWSSPNRPNTTGASNGSCLPLQCNAVKHNTHSETELLTEVAAHAEWNITLRFLFYFIRFFLIYLFFYIDRTSSCEPINGDLKRRTCKYKVNMLMRFAGKQWLSASSHSSRASPPASSHIRSARARTERRNEEDAGSQLITSGVRRQWRPSPVLVLWTGLVWKMNAFCIYLPPGHRQANEKVWSERWINPFTAEQSCSTNPVAS